MSLVTPDNVHTRGGWRVTPLGRIVRPIRMRPEHPLPEPLEKTSAAKRQVKKDAMGKERKRGRERVDESLCGKARLYMTDESAKAEQCDGRHGERTIRPANTRRQ